MTTKLMTNIDSYFYNFIDKESKNNSVSKRELLEHIIWKYIEWKNDQEIKQAYKKMWNDEEYLKELEDNSKLLWTL